MKQKSKRSVLDSHAFKNLTEEKKENTMKETLIRKEFELEADKLENLLHFVDYMLPGVFKQGKSKVIYDRQEDEWTAQMFFVHTEENIKAIGSPFQIRNTLYEMIRQGLK